jgi:hypothetical protein
MNIRHYYHLWAAGAWREPAREHFTTLASSQFAGHVTVSLVGPRPDRAAARRKIRALYPVDDWLEHDTGFEDATLRALRQWVHASHGEHAILYAHTKGAYHPSKQNTAFRLGVTREVVAGWRACVGKLEDHDTAGCYWLTPDRNIVPGRWGGGQVESSLYPGNYWWARASYLRKLPALGTLTEETRFDAEAWIGLAQPRAFDLHPGWPGFRDMRVRMLQDLSGPRPDGRYWPPAGGEFEVAEEEGRWLTRATFAHRPLAERVTS